MKAFNVDLHVLDDDNLIAIAKYCGDQLSLELAERLSVQRDVHAGIYENATLSGHNDCTACGEAIAAFGDED